MSAYHEKNRFLTQLQSGARTTQNYFKELTIALYWENLFWLQEFLSPS